MKNRAVLGLSRLTMKPSRNIRPYPRALGGASMEAAAGRVQIFLRPSQIR